MNLINEKHDAISSAEKILTEAGYNICEFISVIGRRNSSLFNINSDTYKNFSKLYEQLEQEDYTLCSKGKLLERLVFCLFEEGYKSLFTVKSNCRTNTNEIDIFLLWTEQAINSGLPEKYPFLGNSIICECKNYEAPVSVTYVGKFASVLRSSNAKTGIMFAWEGITGKDNWKDAQGFIRKFALGEKIFILIIDKNDLKRIYDRETNIFYILYLKHEALKNDIDYEKYISC